MREVCRAEHIYKESEKRYYSCSIFECPMCGQLVRKIRTDGRKGKTCSIECSRSLRGPRANWKPFVMISGYKYVYCPSHPFGTRCYVAEHRIVMERHLGRVLDPSENIHHLNGDKTDNRIENMIIVSNSEHGKIHSNISTICRRSRK